MTNPPIQREAKIAIKVLGKGILINDRNQGDLVFPPWEQSIPTVGIKFSQRGNDVFPAWERCIPSMGTNREVPLSPLLSITFRL